MLKTSKDALLRLFPKTGTFFVIFQDCDSLPRELDVHTSRIPYMQQQFTWLDGVLYELFEGDCEWPSDQWVKTCIEDQINYFHSEAVVLGFFPVPTTRKIFS